MLIDQRNHLAIKYSTILRYSRITMATGTPIFLLKEWKQYGSSLISRYKPKRNDWLRDRQTFKSGKHSFISNTHVSVFTAPFDGKAAESEESSRKYSNKLKYRMYETIYNAPYRGKIRSNVRNKKYTKNKNKNIYIYIDISISCRARIHRSVLRNCFTLLSEFPKREACGRS